MKISINYKIIGRTTPDKFIKRNMQIQLKIRRNEIGTRSHTILPYTDVHNVHYQYRNVKWEV